MGGRSTICRLADGKLFVYSPVELDEELYEAISDLGGEVSMILAPNYEHLKYTKEWADAFPDAFILACPGLPNRMEEVTFHFEFGSSERPPAVFEESFKAFWWDCEVNPFTGKPFFNEINLIHKQSNALIVADSYWNYPRGDAPNHFGIEGTGEVHQCSKVPLKSTLGENLRRLPRVPVPLGTRLWKFGMDQVYLPFYRRAMIRDRNRYQQLASAVIEANVEVIIPCHGDVIRGRKLSKSLLNDHFFG